MIDSSKEWVTVAEAARRLGIAPRQARRYAAKLAADQRQEPTEGEPLRVLFSAIVEARWRQDAAHPRDSPRDSVPAGVPDQFPGEDRDRDTPSGSVPPLSLSVIKDGFFDQLVAGQVALLKEKDERIADLQSALDHERETSQRLGEALAREQALRLLSLPAPTAAPETAPETAPNLPVEAPESGRGVADPADLGPEPPQNAPQSQIMAFWRRLWGS